MSARRILPWLASSVFGVAFALVVAQHASALDQVTIKVESWGSDAGHGYVGIQATGEWAPPAESRTRVRTKFYSEWQNMGNPGAYCHAWWVWVHRAADDSTVNFDSPLSMTLCGPEPAIGISPSGFGDLSLYLAVGVEPVAARQQHSHW